MYLQSHTYRNIPVSFDFITTLNQGVFLCSPCTAKLHIQEHNKLHSLDDENSEWRVAQYILL